MTIKQSLLKSLNEDGSQTLKELKERMAQAVAAGLMRASSARKGGRGVQAALWELRRDGKVERDDEGLYTALVQHPRAALGHRRREALTRLAAVLEVNKDRIPPEVVRALMSAWQEYIDAFGEDIRTLLKQIVEEVLPLKEL